MEWNQQSRRTKSNIGMFDYGDEEGSQSIRTARLLGHDRGRNRYYECYDERGDAFVLVNVVDQSGWKQYREDFSWQKDGTDSDDELFADYDAALEAEQLEMEVERERDDAESIQRAAERQELERQERQDRLERCARFRMTGFVPRFCTTDGSQQRRWVGCREQRAVDQQRQALAQRSAALPTGDADGASEVAAAAAAAKAAAAAGASAGHRPGPSKGKKNTWCEDCKVKSANYGLPSGQGKRKRWCAGCAQKGASPSARLRRTNGRLAHSVACAQTVATACAPRTCSASC